MHGHTFMACYMHFVRKWRGYASFMSSNLNINKRKTFEKILIFKIQIIQRLDTGIHVDKGNNKITELRTILQRDTCRPNLRMV
jgi:hypothetical protein